MQIEINKDSVIENEFNNRRNTISINGYKLKKNDYIVYNCVVCGNKIKQKFYYRDKFLKKRFICSSCEKKKTWLKVYGTEHPLKNNKIKNKVKDTQFQKYGSFGFNTNKQKETMLIKYGGYTLQSKELKEKIKQTNLKKYGVDNVAQSEVVKEKTKQTNLEKYGTEWQFQSLNFKQKYKETIFDNYGVNHNFKSEKIKKSILETKRKNFFERLFNSNRLKNKVEPLFNDKEYNHSKNKYRWRCKTCGTEFEDSINDGRIPRCPKCYPLRKTTSQFEYELRDWLKTFKIDIIMNDKKILNGKELDLYLPDYKLAIEFNGIYWHSELQGKDRNYHLNKTVECKNQDIQLIHIFEDEWLGKQDIVKSIVKGKLSLNDRIYARKCSLKEVDNKEAKIFYEENHLQGFINSKINIGLFYENKFISCLSFGKSRYNKQYDWEINRFANKLNVSVIGGFAKMLKYFENNYSGSIITYSDRRYFDGSIYRNNGFEELEVSQPNYFYTDKRRRYSRIQYQKHKLEEQLNVYDSNLTEWENMQLNGYDRIWDCGNYRFIKND